MSKNNNFFDNKKTNQLIKSKTDVEIERKKAQNP
jgi:hypothetical protein